MKPLTIRELITKLEEASTIFGDNASIIIDAKGDYCQPVDVGVWDEYEIEIILE